MQIQNKQLSLQSSNEAISTEQRNILHNILIISIGIKSKTFLHTTQENAHFINIWSQGEDKKSISVITLLINKLVHLLHFLGHYKIFCVNGKYGIQVEFRIFYFIALQNEEDYERKESSSA